MAKQRSATRRRAAVRIDDWRRRCCSASSRLYVARILHRRERLRRRASPAMADVVAAARGDYGSAPLAYVARLSRSSTRVLMARARK